MPLFGHLGQNGILTKCVVCNKQISTIKLISHLRLEHFLTIVTTCSQCYYNPNEATAKMYSDLTPEDPVIKVEPRSGDCFRHVRKVHGLQVSYLP